MHPDDVRTAIQEIRETKNESAVLHKKLDLYHRFATALALGEVTSPVILAREVIRVNDKIKKEPQSA